MDGHNVDNRIDSTMVVMDNTDMDRSVACLLSNTRELFLPAKFNLAPHGGLIPSLTPTRPLFQEI